MLDLMNEPEPWYGFKYSYGAKGRSFLDVMNDEGLQPGCMIRLVTPALSDVINQERELGFPDVKDLPFVNVGQFVIFSGSCHSGINSYGPFDSLIDAQDFVIENLGLNYFYQYSDPDFCVNSDETLPESV